MHHLQKYREVLSSPDAHSFQALAGHIIKCDAIHSMSSSLSSRRSEYGYHAITADGSGTGSAAVDEPEHTATVSGTSTPCRLEQLCGLPLVMSLEIIKEHLYCLLLVGNLSHGARNAFLPGSSAHMAARSDAPSSWTLLRT